MPATNWTQSTENATFYGPTTSGNAISDLLLETGSRLLQETGDRILLENFIENPTNWTKATQTGTTWTQV